ncbi:hypothetical protein BJY52DRAFT_1232657 [Lactarius psammicola]|nr:hypothetical protein BJY52DRAFT_1232657 [Lactarius psammicola]
MQSDIGSHSLSGGSQLSSTAPATAPAHPIDDVFEITQEDASILEEYIEEFKEGDADTRSRIIANVMAELYALRDGTVSFNKKDADRRVRKWFYNRYSPPERKYIKFTRKWSARSDFVVVIVVHPSSLGHRLLMLPPYGLPHRHPPTPLELPSSGSAIILKPSFPAWSPLWGHYPL